MFLLPLGSIRENILHLICHHIGSLNVSCFGCLRSPNLYIAVANFSIKRLCIIIGLAITTCGPIRVHFDYLHYSLNNLLLGFLIHLLFHWQIPLLPPAETTRGSCISYPKYSLRESHCEVNLHRLAKELVQTEI